MIMTVRAGTIGRVPRRAGQRFAQGNAPSLAPTDTAASRPGSSRRSQTSLRWCAADTPLYRARAPLKPQGRKRTDCHLPRRLIARGPGHRAQRNTPLPAYGRHMHRHGASGHPHAPYSMRARNHDASPIRPGNRRRIDRRDTSYRAPSTPRARGRIRVQTRSKHGADCRAESRNHEANDGECAARALQPKADCALGLACRRVVRRRTARRRTVRRRPARRLIARHQAERRLQTSRTTQQALRR